MGERLENILPTAAQVGHRTVRFLGHSLSMKWLLCLASFLAFTIACSDQWKRIALSPHVSMSIPPGAVAIDPGTPAPKDTKLWAFFDGHAAYLAMIWTASSKEDLEDPPDQALAAAIAGLGSSMEKPMIKSQRDILVNGWPGLEDLIVSEGKQATLVRVFYLGKQGIMMGVSYVPTHGRPATSDVFFSSLKITPVTASGPLKTAGPTFEPLQPKGADFTIGMPSKAETSQDMGSSGATLYEFLARYGNRTYMTGYLDFPVSMEARAAVAAARHDCLYAAKAKVLKEAEDVKRGEQTFSTMDFTAPNGMGGRLDITTREHRVYVMLMLYPVGHAGSPDIDAFFSSFKLVGK